MFNSSDNSLYPSSSYNGYYDAGFGYSLCQCFQPNLFEQFWIGTNNFITPRSVIYNIFGDPEKTFRPRKLNKSGNRYYMSERDKREVNIGELKLKSKCFINPKPDGTFDAFYCKAELNGNTEEVHITIPYKDFVKRNILPYLSKFERSGRAHV